MRSDESKPLSLMTLRAQDDEKAARTRKVATSKNSVLSLVLDGEEEFLLLKCSFPFFIKTFSFQILSCLGENFDTKKLMVMFGRASINVSFFTKHFLCI